MRWALPDSLPTSGIRDILNIAVQTPDAIRLETGEPDQPPAPHILNAFIDASRTGHNRYTATEGIPSLRDALAHKISTVNHVPRVADNVLVTPGGLPALFLAFMGTAKKGEEILVPDPGWPDYLGGLKSLGISALPYTLLEPNFWPDIADLDRLVSPATRAIVLNFPSNPTGSILPYNRITQIVEWATRRDLWIISDEVYDQIYYEHPPISPATMAPERTLSVYSFSKTYAMTGWRLGYLSGSTEAIRSLTRVAMGLWSSVSEPLQYAGLAAILGPQDHLTKMQDHYHHRRDRAITQLQAAHIKTHTPQGAFYLLVNITQSGLSSTQFSMDLLRTKKVAVAPGEAFGHQARAAVRISLASSDNDLTEGIHRLITFLKSTISV